MHGVTKQTKCVVSGLFAKETIAQNQLTDDACLASGTFKSAVSFTNVKVEESNRYYAKMSSQCISRDGHFLDEVLIMEIIASRKNDFNVLQK